MNDWLKLALLGVAAGIGVASVGFTKTPYDDIFDRVGKDQSIDPNLLRGFGKAESNFNSNAIRKESDTVFSIGVMQVLNTNAESYGVTVEKLYDPATNILVAAKLLNDMRRQLGTIFTLDSWISAYNEGAHNVLTKGIKNYDYVAKVELYYRLYSLGKVVA